MLLLKVDHITVYYEKVEALKKVSLEVEEGEIVCLIGANGAGKSTVLKTISGLKATTSGEIWYQDRVINKMPINKIVRLGVSLVPEGRRLFSSISVLKNLEMGAYLRRNGDEKKRSFQKVFGHFPVLKDRLKQKAGSLSGGEQQMLAMGRALMADPKLLLLDEPSLGLAPLMVEEIGKIVTTINQNGVSIVLVEQNAALALSLANKGYVLETGRVVMEGRSDDLLNNQKVIEAYLGQREQ